MHGTIKRRSPLKRFFSFALIALVAVALGACASQAKLVEKEVGLGMTIGIPEEWEEDSYSSNGTHRSFFVSDAEAAAEDSGDASGVLVLNMKDSGLTLNDSVFDTLTDRVGGGWKETNTEKGESPDGGKLYVRSFEKGDSAARMVSFAQNDHLYTVTIIANGESANASQALVNQIHSSIKVDGSGA